jgi:glycosyltransferase involved in cell wall biosynthesis
MSIRIGLATYFLPAPVNSGVLIRVWRFARALARLGPITLYAMAPAKEAEELADHADLKVYSRVRLHRLDRGELARLGGSFTETAIGHWMNPDTPLCRLVREDNQAEPLDVVVCAQLMTANVALAIPEVPLVLDEHNVESQSMAQMYASLPLAYRIDEGPAIQAVRAYEQHVWAAARLITCVTQAEAQHIQAHTATPVQVLPNGVAVGEVPFTPPSRREGPDILFVGTFRWPPNVKAARFLAREVMPRIWPKFPPARLVLCGTRPGADVVFLQRPGVEVTGTVPSVAPYLARAAVYANALFEGTGSSLKVLEPLAAGIPLVSTAVGARGFPLVPGRHYLPAEDADSFAQALLAVLRQRGVFDEQARQGRTLAEEFDWDPIAAQFASLVAGVVKKKF